MSELDETTVQARRLADELRRVLNRLVLVRPPAGALAAAADAAAAFAERLDALPARFSPGEVSEAGLFPRNFPEHSPVSGLSNPLAPPVVLRVVDGAYVEGDVTFGAAYEGPPRHVHGGYVAAMFDELLGFAQLGPGYTGTLTVVYRRPAPLYRPLRLWAGVDRVEGRKRYVRGTCRLDDDTLLAECEGVFIAPRDLHVLAPERLADEGAPEDC